MADLAPFTKGHCRDTVPFTLDGIRMLEVREWSSPLSVTDNARHAVDPVNAVLNLAYAVLATQ